MKNLIFILLLALSATTFAQTGIGTTTPNASAQLDVESTTKGFLPPRMTTVQKNAISSPAEGLVVYDTDLNTLSAYDGVTWNSVGSGGLKLIASVVNASSVGFTRRLGYTYKVVIVGGNTTGSAVSQMRINNYGATQIYRFHFTEMPWSGSPPVEQLNSLTYDSWRIANIQTVQAYNTQISLDISFIDNLRVRYTGQYSSSYFSGRISGYADYDFAGTAESTPITLNFGANQGTWAWNASSPKSIAVYEYQQ